MRVTLREVAEHAGVSMMTVSNVMNGNRARVSPSTIEKVQRIADELGYVPSASARSLATQASRLVGLLVPAADEDSLMISPHTMAIVGLIERELRKYGYHLLLRGVAHPDEVAEALRSWSLDGAILLGFLDEEVGKLTKKTIGAVHVVAIDSYSANRLTTGPRSDDFAGAWLAAKHLLNLGHRRILFAGPAFSGVGVVHERFEGFCQAFVDAGVSRPDLVETVNTTYAEGHELGVVLRERHALTAVFATADILAVGIVHGLTEAGARVPEDVSVVGFDNLDLCDYVTPKLTTVSQDIARKASTAVSILLGSIERGERPEQPVTIDVSLVQRESTAPVTSAQ
ncbi:LacI family DNA-binding transcriptional regulator [Amycolatopsis sp. lyj-23]|uniref:LacI family DNA-binding transcriptional regulator n=1 Tax=Amycolatopsis sp. lyj-23 TaxID=2789283 RepID=UPI00397D9930